MKPAPFSYHRPASLDEALALLARHPGEARLLAGGQSLVPMMNMRLATPAHLVDINDLSELGRIRLREDRLEVGALARHRELAESPLVRRHLPLLAQAVGTIGHDAIRERGTVGGSLANADPVAQHVLVALTLGARLSLVSARGRREVDAADFFSAAMTTTLAPDEMLLSVSYPCMAADEAGAYRMFNQRHGDYAIVSVAAALAAGPAGVRALRLGVAGVGPVPRRFDAVTAAFLGRPADDAWVSALAQAVAAAVAPEDDGRIPAVYRRELTEALVAGALGDCLARSEART